VPKKSPLSCDHFVATGEHQDAIVIQVLAGLPKSFGASRKNFGMLLRAQHVFEIGTTWRGIQ
jgi:hypothetical protein